MKKIEQLTLIRVIAGLWHDIGKTYEVFQLSLVEPRVGIRHEMVSILILDAYFNFEKLKSDQQWIDRLGGEWGIKQNLFNAKKFNGHNFVFPCEEKTPILYQICWLILSHHKLPNHDFEGNTGDCVFTKKEYVPDIKENYIGSTNKKTFESAPWKDPKWLKKVTEAAGKFRHDVEISSEILAYYGRLAFQVSDHTVSSRDAGCDVVISKDADKLYANTKTRDGKVYFNQELTPHLIAVGDQESVPALCSLELPHLTNIPPILIAKIPTVKTDYSWADEACFEINKLENNEFSVKSSGFFAVVSAATGTGKTIGCPKILNAASDKLRFVFAHPMRSLTLQCGDSFEKDLGLNESEFASIIGDGLIKKIHDAQKDDGICVDDETIMCSGNSHTDNELINGLYGDNEKMKNFLITPILSATIDSLMKIADAKRGGHVAHGLRVMTSDLIIDEVDSYSDEDLVVIGKLIELSGMSGRKVIISSATICPATSKAFYRAYKNGYQKHCEFFGKELNLVSGLFSNDINVAFTTDDFDEQYDAFVEYSVTEILRKNPKRIIKEWLKSNCFKEIFGAAVGLHKDNHINKDGVELSVGLLAMGTVDSCIELSEFFALQNHPDYDLKIVCHHARQHLVTRQFIDKELDKLLTRKNNASPFDHEKLSGIIKHTIVLVITTLEFIGRDHDYDWGIIDPVSQRMTIQACGRILRHRNTSGTNIVLLSEPLGGYHVERSNKHNGDRKYKIKKRESVVSIPGSVINEMRGCVNSVASISSYELKNTPYDLVAVAEYQKNHDMLKNLIKWVEYKKCDKLMRLSNNHAKDFLFRRDDKEKNVFWIDKKGTWLQHDATYSKVKEKTVEFKISNIEKINANAFLFEIKDIEDEYQKMLKSINELDSPETRVALLGISCNFTSGAYHKLLGMKKIKP